MTTEGDRPDAADGAHHRDLAGDLPSRVVVDVVGAVTDTSPAHLAPPLYESVDPDALDALVTAGPDGHARGRLEIQFAYHDYRITVTPERVTVE